MPLTEQDKAVVKVNVADALASINFAEITSVSKLQHYVEMQLGITLRIIETSVLNGINICGVWGKQGNLDIIFHAETKSSIHRDQIVLHELAHMLLKHESDSEHTEYDLARSLFPDLDPGHFLLRTGLTTRAEQEAEYLADNLARNIRNAKKKQNRFEGVFG